jgi:hypothetical protein
MFGLDIG